MVSILKYRDTTWHRYQTFRLPNINDSLNLYDLDLRRKYRVSSIEHNSGIVRYRSNYGIVPALTHTEERNIPGQVQSVAAQDTIQGMYTYRGEQHSRTGSRCGCTRHKTRYANIHRRATLQDRFKVWLHKTQDKVYTHTEESNIPGQVQSVAAQDIRQGMYTYREEKHSRTGSKCGCTRHKTRYIHIERRAIFQDRFKVWLHKTQDQVCTHREESNIPGQVQSVAAQDTRQGIYTYRGEKHSRTGSRCGCTRHKTRYVHIKGRATLQDRFKVWLHKTQDKVCTHTEESIIPGQVHGVAAQDTRQGMYT